MALLLNIDTATEVASVCISLNGGSIAFKENNQQREHASFVHLAIQSILSEAGVRLEDVDAFAVTSGPGSYTGLRVGMATAKGFCYAFSKPLIAVNTLQVMANAALETVAGIDSNTLLCPMIDARRMEVFTALYDSDLNSIVSPQPWILEEKSFNSFMTKGKILFFGSGSSKFSSLVTSENAAFEQVQHSAKHLASLAEKEFQQKKFSDVSYSAPEYLKDFHTIAKGQM